MFPSPPPAGKLETPEQYARWMLDLAPVRVGPPAPVLAASLLGGTSLADRVWRILRGEARSARPLGRRARVGLALAAFLILGTSGSVRLVEFAGRAAAGEPSDAPLPDVTPAQLAARIREAMGRYDDRGSFRVVFTSTHDMNWNFEAKGGKPEEQKPILVSYRGRARHDSDGTRWRAEYEGKSPTLGTSRMWPDRWSSGFDGAQAYHWRVSHHEFILGESVPFHQQWGPRFIIWERSEDLAPMLEDPDGHKTAIAISQRVVDGVRCYIVESKTRDGEWGGETVVSPRQGYLPISRKWTRRGRVYSTYSLQGVHEVVDGIWAPDRTEDESLSVGDDGTSRLFSRRRLQIVEYRPRRVPPASTFRFEIPYGVDFTDRRLGWSYHNDPWWPEIGAMLREKYHWPPPDFSPLRDLGSPREKKLDGAAAPPLRVATWVNAKPIDLAALRGKVVLLEFWNMTDPFRRSMVPALNHLYATYHTAGLEIVSIHPPTRTPDELRRFLREYRIEFPVAIDAAGPPSWGATADAYGARDATFAFLIDREGKLHSVDASIGNVGSDGGGSGGSGRLVEAIVSLLKKAGAVDVKAVSIQTPRLPDQALKDAEGLYPAAFKAALDAQPPGKIAVRVVDASHRPIAGATVQVTPRFIMLMLTQPGANYLVSYPAAADRFHTATGKDGLVEFPGLCKGAYQVRVRAPGLAWKEREAFLAPDLKPASLDFVLDQGDAISGEVRDPQGRPIAGATIIPVQRQHYVEDELQYTTGAEGVPVQTDDAGRFRFGRLQEGRYAFQVKARGFKDRELEPVWAGNGNVVATLERSP